MSIFFVRYVISLIFGTLMTFVFGAIPLKGNSKKILGITGALLVIETVLNHFFGLQALLSTYPLHTHLLLILFLVVIYKMRFYNAMMYVLLAYMSCQLPAWFSKFSQYLFPGNAVAEIVAYSLFAIIFALVMLRFVGDSAKALLEGSTLSKAVFGLIPITYYLFDYSTTFWTDLLYSGNYHITQFIPLVLCVGYPIFIIGYRNEQKRRQQIYQDKVIVEHNLDMIEGEIDSIREIEKMSRIYRHDMRHHLQLLQSLLQEGKIEQAQSYIAENIQAVTEVTPERYCDIDILNLLLTHYGDLASKEGISYHFDVKLPAELPISNMEICALVSNTLDNAYKASLAVPVEKRKLELVFKEHNGMLIFSVDNACDIDTKVNAAMQTVAWDKGHVFGTKSIEVIAKKYKGEVRFSVKDGIFSTMVLMQNYK